MTTISASSRLGKLVLTCSVCKAEKVFDGMVARVVIKRFAAHYQKQHEQCAEKVNEPVK